MTDKIVLAEVNAILKSIESNASARGFNETVELEGARSEKISSSAIKKLKEKLNNIASKFLYKVKPTDIIPVESLESGALIYDKLIEVARQISNDVHNNITCSACKSSCMSTNSMGSTAVHKDTTGTKQCNGTKEGTTGI